MHFLGQPIDYIIFEGLKDDDIKKVVFLEVKTGQSKLTKREKSLKNAIDKKRVSWKELRVDTKDEKTPDKEIATEETSVKEIYDDIDKKLEKEKRDLKDEENVEDEDEENGEEQEEEYEVICPKCDEEFTLELDEDDDLEEGIRVKCPSCKKSITITEDDVV